MTLENVEKVCRSEVFQCPYCGAYAKQEWHDVAKGHRLEIDVGYYEGFLAGLSLSVCSKCGGYALWRGDKMIYPVLSTAPSPVVSMPADVKEYFLEAREVFNASPRAAAALLRLALQQLVVHLGGRGKNLNRDVVRLARKGLPPLIQEALVSVRFIGSDAEYPGKISSKDDTHVAIALFDLVNMIVEIMLARPEKVDGTCGKSDAQKSYTRKRKRSKIPRKKREQKEEKWNSIFYR